MMSYIVFGLGIVLTAVGLLAIYAGFDIIQIERGWTEVISGTMAVSGGIVTISLALFLYRIESIAKLFAGPAQLAAAAPVMAAEPQFMAPLIVDPTDTLAEPEPVQVATATIPAPVLAPAPDPYMAPVSPFTPKPSPAFRKPVRPPIWQQSPFPTAEIPEQESAHFEDMPHILAADREEPSNLPLTNGLAGLEETYTPEPEPEPKPELKVSSRESSSALLFDEMWKRVSDEIEKPIFAPRAQKPVPPREETQTPLPQSKPDAFEALIATEARSSLSLSRFHDQVHEDADALREPNSSSDWNARISSIDSVSFTSALPQQPTLVDELSATYSEEAEPPWISDSPTQEEKAKSQPAVVGRYEAEGTAYLMFSDGSIEAQSEAGIFYFASMADLKAFIESKQAAAS